MGACVRPVEQKQNVLAEGWLENATCDGYVRRWPLVENPARHVEVAAETHDVGGRQ